MSCGEEKRPINTVVIHSIIAGQLSSIFTFKGNTGGEGLCDDSNSRPSDEARVSKADCVHTCLIEFNGLQLWQSKKILTRNTIIRPPFIPHGKDDCNETEKMVIRKNMMGLLFRKYEGYVSKQRRLNPIVRY